MKILIVTPYFYPKIGGVEKHVFYIAEGLKERGHDIVVVTSNHTTSKRIEEKVQGLRVIRLPRLLKFSNTPFNPAWGRQLKKIIKVEKPDIIEAHSPVPGLADLAFSKRGKVPFIIKYHSGSMKKNKRLTDLLIGGYEKFFLKIMLERSDAIMSVYPNFIRTLIGSSEKIHYIPPGVDALEFSPSKKKVKTTDVLYVGRIEHSSSWKGIGTLIEAVAKIVKDEPSVKLKIVGNGDAVNHFKRQVTELGIEKNVEFTGSLRGKKLIAVYNDSKVLVLPSESDAESFGNVLIEAMACGTPVVGSKIGGIPNVIENNKDGILFQPKNSTSLADAIKRIIYDEKFSAKLAEEALIKVREKFTKKSLIDKTEYLLKDTVRSKALVKGKL